MDKEIAEKPGHDGGEDHPGRFVTITVNTHSHEISRGRHSIEEIKKLDGVPLADELALVVEGHDPEPLKDDGHITIKGGEVFISDPRDSASS